MERKNAPVILCHVGSELFCIPGIESVCNSVQELALALRGERRVGVAVAVDRALGRDDVLFSERRRRQSI